MRTDVQFAKRAIQLSWNLKLRLSWYKFWRILTTLVTNPVDEVVGEVAEKPSICFTDWRCIIVCAALCCLKAINYQDSFIKTSKLYFGIRSLESCFVCLNSFWDIIVCLRKVIFIVHFYRSTCVMFLLLNGFDHYDFSGISCVQFDDTRIVSGSSDKTIKVNLFKVIMCLSISYV